MTLKEPASLASVKLRRGPRGFATREKPGDLTAHLRPVAPPPSRPADAAPEAIAPAAALAEIGRAETPPPTPTMPAVIHDAGKFIDYWHRLRREHALPALDLLDRELVAENWPDSLMVTYATLDAPMPRIARLSKPTGAVEYTPMVTDWIISCAREVARHGEAMEDEQEFPITRGTANYHLLLLPFAGAQGESDHVLCHLSRASTEPAAQP